MGNSKKPQDSDGSLYFLSVAILLFFVSQSVTPEVERLRQFILLHSKQFYLCFVGLGLFLILLLAAALWNKHLNRKEEELVTSEDQESVCLGMEIRTKKLVHLKAPFRTTHTQLIGTTSAGKTASVILPWAARDIELGRGLILIDGKADQNFLNQLYAQAVKNKREKDFMVFSLASPGISSTFNPFCQGTPEQITERVFSAFSFTDEYYRSIQFSALRTVVSLLRSRGQVPIPGVIREFLRDKEKLKGWHETLEDKNLSEDILSLTSDSSDEFSKKYSGLVTALGHFSQGETAALYNVKAPEIVLSEVLKSRKICYFQLPTMQFPFLGEATGKLLLQSIQSAISELQVNEGGSLKSLFSVYLDDSNDYIYPGFVSLLNKSRSANIGVVFAHQSLGDLEKVSPDFKQIVLTDTNVKIIMRSNDPDSAEYFAKTIGTKRAEKTTERRTRGLFGAENTGEQSVRDVEEYLFHPNVFKADLKRGEGIVLIPHPSGRVVKHIRFHPISDLPPVPLPVRRHSIPDFSSEAMCHKPGETQISTPRGKQSKKSKQKRLKEENTG